MALGVINLNNRNDLEKLSKDELINLIIDRSNELKNLADNIINYSEEELIEYQKELKAIKEMASIFVYAQEEIDQWMSYYILKELKPDGYL